ncbi:MAG: lipid II flippase MurJ, partial [Yoonia sp.]
AQFDTRFKRRIWRIIVAACLMGVVLFGVAWALPPLLAAGGLRMIGLLILVVAGIVSYFAIGQIIGAFRLAEFKAAMRRSK